MQAPEKDRSKGINVDRVDPRKSRQKAPLKAPPRTRSEQQQSVATMIPCPQPAVDRSNKRAPSFSVAICTQVPRETSADTKQPRPIQHINSVESLGVLQRTEIPYDDARDFYPVPTADNERSASYSSLPSSRNLFIFWMRVVLCSLSNCAVRVMFPLA